MRALILAAVGLVGCGAQPQGGACDAGQPAECGGASVSICEAGAWANYACPGACGASCDWSKAKVGQACPKSFDGVGGVACNAAGTALIGCRDGVFKEVACPVCVRQDWGFFTCT